MATETLQKSLSTMEAMATAMLEECYKTRMLIIQDGVSTPSTDQRPFTDGPLSQQQLAAISAKRRLKLAKAKRK